MTMSFCARPMSVLAAMLLCATALLAWGDEQETPASAYQGKGYTIVYPPGWDIQQGFMGTDSLALSPMETPQDTFRENVNVVLEEVPAGIDLAQYLELTLKNLKNVFGENCVVAVKEHQNRGRAVTVIEYTGKMGVMDLHNNAHIVLEDGTAYIVTCSMLQGASRTTHLATLVGIADTLDVVKTAVEP